MIAYTNNPPKNIALWDCASGELPVFAFDDALLLRLSGIFENYLTKKERKKEECRKHEWQARVFYIVRY